MYKYCNLKINVKILNKSQISNRVCLEPSSQGLFRIVFGMKAERIFS